jgi:hypothetical protein
MTRMGLTGFELPPADPLPKLADLRANLTDREHLLMLLEFLEQVHPKVAEEADATINEYLMEKHA